MSLSKEKIRKNAERYFKFIEKYGAFNDELVELLGEDFIKAPASPREDLYNAFDGGLIKHIFTVGKYISLINEQLPDNLKVDKDSLLRVSLLYQIGKAHLFTPTTEDWKKNKGIYYDYNNELITMRVSERSLYYLSKCCIKLTDEEYSAIVNFDKLDSDLQSKYHNNMLGELLKMANTIAIKDQKK